ncbi:MAG: response regulator [Algoriphagus sp.]|nr:response regulator [Algoriphagus sp.]
MTPINILLVEDNEGDILLTTEALEEGKIPKSLKVIRDGSSMLIYLKEIAERSPSELPDLILLDINLPKKNGHEVLKEVKSNKLIQHIPIIMLTTSSSEMDILKSYQEHANCYLIKPMEIGDFIQVVTKIEEFWLNLVKLPKML